MTSPYRSIAVFAGLAILAVLVVQWLRPDTTGPRPGVTVVDGGGGVVTTAAPPAAATRSDVTTPTPIEPMIDEAPPVLRSLHASVARDRDPARAVEEARVAALFAGDAALGATDVTVRCARAHCEVHGLATGDESDARMAMGGDAFLDRLLAAGYSAGMNMVSGRAQGGSEFVIYLEPR